MGIFGRSASDQALIDSLEGKVARLEQRLADGQAEADDLAADLRNRIKRRDTMISARDRIIEQGHFRNDANGRIGPRGVLPLELVAKLQESA